MKDPKLQGSTSLDNASQNQDMNDAPEHSMPAPLVLLLAVATGMTVASIYYAQPLLEAIRNTLGLSVTRAGLIITASRSG